MLPLHSYANKRRVFSKNETTLWMKIHWTGRIVIIALFYLAIFLLSFFIVIRLNIIEDESIKRLAYWNPDITYTFYEPSSLLKSFQTSLKTNDKNRVIQHLFLEQVRAFRQKNPQIYSIDQDLHESFPEGWQGHKPQKYNHQSSQFTQSRNTENPSDDNTISLNIKKIHKPSREIMNDLARLSVPVILTGIIDHWKAYHEWTDEYLEKKIGNVKVPIEFSKGLSFSGETKRQRSEDMTVRDFLKQYRNPNRERNYYLAETSILENFKVLQDDFPMHLDFIPQHWKLNVIQLWIGPGGQITPIHNDEAENILCQFKGSRMFYLHDPVQVDLLYTNPENQVYPFVKVREGKSNFLQYPLFAKSYPSITLFLNEGECIYLPALFYHQVESTPNLRSLAINYWYTPQSKEAELIWLAMSAHEWRQENEPFVLNRKRS